MTQKHILSKSTFLRGLQCHKSLYLNRYNRDLRDEISPEQQAVFATGREVGELARGLFPGGVQSKPPNSFQFQRAVEVTRELIDGGKNIIYEAAFQHEQVLALVDILVREGDEWRAYEVKSSASLKDVHIPDASIQYFIMKGQGVELADISIVSPPSDAQRIHELVLQSGDAWTVALDNVERFCETGNGFYKVPAALKFWEAALALQDAGNRFWALVISEGVQDWVRR